MKDKFYGHIQFDEVKSQDIWNDAIFVFDANVLLSLYGLSPSSRKSMLGLFERLKDNIWIPYQFCHEYIYNRTNKISEQLLSYEESIRDLKKVLELFKNKKKHPFVEDSVISKFEEVIEGLQNESRNLQSFYSNDEILKTLMDILHARVGNEYTSQQLQVICSEGKTRYSNKIPPGFSDEKKPEPQRFGDLIGWKQVLDHFKTKNSPCILITRDMKEDWWYKEKGAVVGPLPQLRDEFHEVTGNDILLYPLDTFLIKTKDYLKDGVSDQVIDEVILSQEENESDEKDASLYVDTLDDSSGEKESKASLKEQADTIPSMEKEKFQIESLEEVKSWQ